MVDVSIGNVDLNPVLLLVGGGILVSVYYSKRRRLEREYERRQPYISAATDDHIKKIVRKEVKRMKRELLKELKGES